MQLEDLRLNPSWNAAGEAFWSCFEGRLRADSAQVPFMENPSTGLINSFLFQATRKCPGVRLWSPKRHGTGYSCSFSGSFLSQFRA